MDERTIIDVIVAHLGMQFPKTCPNCGRVFQTLPDYLRGTTYVGQPIAYDLELDDWQPVRPIGTFSHSNCPCGSTLAIGTSGIPIGTLWAMLRWARVELRRRGIPLRDMLEEIRHKIDARAFELEAEEKAAAPQAVKANNEESQRLLLPGLLPRQLKLV